MEWWNIPEHWYRILISSLCTRKTNLICIPLNDTLQRPEGRINSIKLITIERLSMISIVKTSTIFEFLGNLPLWLNHICALKLERPTNRVFISWSCIDVFIITSQNTNQSKWLDYNMKCLYFGKIEEKRGIS